MTDNIINFRKAKKSVAKAKKESRAEENRARFGRTKTEKLKDASEKSKLASHVDGHKLDAGEDKPK